MVISVHGLCLFDSSYILIFPSGSKVMCECKAFDSTGEAENEL